MLTIFTSGSISYTSYLNAFIASCEANIKSKYKVVILCTDRLRISDLSFKKKTEIINIVERFPHLAHVFSHESYTDHFNRLVIPRLVDDGDYAIYIDADTLVLKDLQHIKTIKFSDKFSFGCVVDYVPFHKYAVSNYGALGLNPYNLYYNSGVIIFNPTKYSSNRHMLEDCFNFYLENSGSSKIFGVYEQYDQFPFNALYHNIILTLPKVYNYPSQMKEDGYIVILHFLGEEGKPGRETCNKSFSKMFKQYS